VSAAPTPVPIIQLSIKLIRTDGQTQSRVRTDPSVVSDYADLMKSGVRFPPIRTWFDGGDYWLVDGFQRLAAATSIGCERITAEVITGSLSEAQWDSYAANAVHGSRRTKADIEGVIRRTLQHPNALQLSNSQIARYLHLPEATFRRLRKQLSSSPDEDKPRIVTRCGKTYPMQTGRIGKHCEPKPSRPSRKALQEDLNQMKTMASSDADRIINVLTHWINGRSTGPSTLALLERIIAEFRRVNSVT
jgi:hypothetical protein